MKQGVQVTAVDTHIIGDIINADGITVVVLNELYGSADIEASILSARRRNYIEILRKNTEEGVQQALAHELMNGRVGVLRKHRFNGFQQPRTLAAAVRKPAASKPQRGEIIGSVYPVKSDPNVGPGLLTIGLIEGLYAGFNQKTLTCREFVDRAAGAEAALSLQDIVQNIIGAYRRTEAVTRQAVLVSAETQIQIRKRMRL